MKSRRGYITFLCKCSFFSHDRLFFFNANEIQKPVPKNKTRIILSLK